MPIDSPHTIRTPRLSLRPYRDEDLEVLYALWTHDRIAFWIFGDEPVSKQQAQQAIEHSRAAFAQSGYGHWCICRRSDDAVIGFCGLLKPGDPFRDPIVRENATELYYGLDPSEWSKGLVTEAAAAVVKYGLEQCRLPVIVALVDEDNQASRRVVEKLGFSFVDAVESEGVLVRYYRIPAATTAPTTG